MRITETGILEATDINEIGPTGGLVGFWPLDGNALDYSGNLLDGTATSTTMSSGIGKYKGYDFNGTTSYIDCGSSSLLTLSSGGTISAWVKLRSWNTTSFSSTIVGKGTSSWANHHYIIFKLAGEECFIFSLSDGTTSLQGSGPKTPTLGLNTWYHIVATWNNTTKSIYTNGILSQAVSSTIMPSVTASYVSIGRTGNNGYFIDGVISDVRLYNRALSANEIQILYRMKETPMQVVDGTVYLAGEFKNN